MKKKTFLILLMMALLPLSNVRVMADPIGVQLQVRITDPEDDQDNKNRNPIIIPEICIEDYTVYFDTPCDGYTLRLVDEDNIVVYSTVIPANTIEVVLPAYLSGTFELQLILGNLCFYGEIDL
jgi:hypothetical protein